MKAINRDDLPPEVLEALEAQLEGTGMKLVCAGDIPGGVPAEIVEAMQILERKHNESLAYGTCIDCGTKMPNYPPTDDDNWQPAKGWKWFTEHNSEEPLYWQCPECDAKESEE